MLIKFSLPDDPDDCIEIGKILIRFFMTIVFVFSK